MSFNKVILLGRLGKDPELRFTPSQTPVCELLIATSDRRKGQDGQWAEHTEWHNVVTFGAIAENCAKYLQKGRQALIDGKMQTRKYQDKQGVDKYWTEVIAHSVQFVGGGGGAGRGEGPGAPANDYAGAPAGSTASAASPNVETSVSFDDDDIPF